MDIKSFETHIKNIIRVYSARNERDLHNVMEIVYDVFTYARTLENRLDALERDSDNVEGSDLRS